MYPGDNYRSLNRDLSLYLDPIPLIYPFFMDKPVSVLYFSLYA
jgi:hypothetical protein